MDASSNTIIADMPEDILKKIFSYVDQYEGLKTCSCVCRRWKVLSDHIFKIREHYLRRGINLQWSRIWMDDGKFAALSFRQYRTACYLQGSVYIIGGFTKDQTLYNDIWKFDLSSRQWKHVLFVGELTLPTIGSTVVAYKHFLIQFGGCKADCCRNPYGDSYVSLSNELSIYNVKQNTCSVKRDKSAPKLACHSASVVGDLMIIFGGINSAAVCDGSVYAFDIKQEKWFTPFIKGQSPEARFLHSQVVVDDKHLLIIGGRNSSGCILNDVWLLMLGEEWEWKIVTCNNCEIYQPFYPQHFCCAVGDKVYLINCFGSNMFKRNPETFDRFMNPLSRELFTLCLSIASGSLDWMHFSKDRLTNFTLKSIIGIVMNRDIFGELKLNLKKSRSIIVMNLCDLFKDFSVRYEMVESRTTLPLFTEFFLTIKAEGELISFGGSEISATRSKIMNSSSVVVESSLGICTPTEAVLNQLKEFRMRKNVTSAALILKIDHCSHELICEELIENCSIENINEALLEDEPRFVLLCRRTQHSDGRVSFPFVLIFVSPSGCIPEVQMLYAGSVRFVRELVKANNVIMYLKTWEEFVKVIEKLYEEDPDKFRFITKYSHQCTRLEFKATNDRVCAQYSTDAFQDLKRFEKLLGTLMRNMASREK
ncbi:F-box only protein 42 [Trichinella pseudospiralis]|uniref:F-box only protein 42 n=4 Tax=Trichinella pseudospiralis TaxID=6337 RepID=A0A0V1JBF1_TRIPS|nr:F-box only protein 42 [Trichinella pseudospiralis]KRZ32298.1 F-box only protein 42 [Trichinella pseudospiralis]